MWTPSRRALLEAGAASLILPGRAIADGLSASMSPQLGGGIGSGFDGGISGNAAVAVNPALANFMVDGASRPLAWSAAWPSAIYDSPGVNTGKTWTVYQGYGNFTQATKCITFNHSTRKWVGPCLVGFNQTPQDNDSQPSLAFGSDKFGYSFFGCHNTSCQVASTAAAGDETLWVVQPSLTRTNGMTFPQPNVIGSTIYLQFTGQGSGTAPEGQLVIRPLAASAGVLTPSADVVLVDFLNNNLLPGTSTVRSGKIHTVWQYVPGTTITTGSDIFYGIWDPVAGSLTSFDGSTTIAAGSLPISLATAQASFRVVNMSGTAQEGWLPIMLWDLGSPNACHILYTIGASGGGPYSLKHIYNSGSGWSSPDNLFNYPSSMGTKATVSQLTPNVGGGVDAWWLDCTGPGFPTIGNGNLFKASWNAGVFGAGAQYMAEQLTGGGTAYGLFDSPMVINGLPEYRLNVSQVTSAAYSGVPVTSDGTLKAWGLGDGGILARITSFSFQAQDLFDRAGMSLPSSIAYLQALDTYVKGMISAGFWDLFDIFYFLGTDNSTFAALNWTQPRFGLTVGGGAPAFTRNVGFAFNGTSDYLRTGFNPSTQKGARLSASGATVMGHWPSFVANANVGCFISGTTSLFVATSNTNFTPRVLGNAGGTFTVGNGTGFFAGSRAFGGSTQIIGQAGSTPEGPTAQTNTGLPNIEFTLGAVGGTLSYAAQVLGGCGCGAPLTAAQLAAWATLDAACRATVAGL